MRAGCNGNGIPDETDIADGTSEDCNGNSIPDECIDLEDDCNANGIPDECIDLENDCNADGVPDECLLDPENDCNANGVHDECDVDDGIATDFNLNDVLDECECFGDLNNDQVTGDIDFVVLLASWGPCEPGCFSDIIPDGDVGITDMLALLTDWGPCPPTGACCLGTSCAQHITVNICTNVLGGVFQGDGTDCSDVQCSGTP